MRRSEVVDLVSKTVADEIREVERRKAVEAIYSRTQAQVDRAKAQVEARRAADDRDLRKWCIESTRAQAPDQRIAEAELIHKFVTGGAS